MRVYVLFSMMLIVGLYLISIKSYSKSDHPSYALRGLCIAVVSIDMGYVSLGTEAPKTEVKRTS